MPIDELVAADGTDLDEWFEHFLGLQYYQGQLYGFPSWGWAGFDTLVTNTVHLEEAGIDLPDPSGRDVSIDTINEVDLFTAAVGLRFFQNIPLETTDPRDHLLMAAASVMTIPVITLFAVAQRYFIQGVVLSGLKI
jgi:hypothetical protein